MTMLNFSTYFVFVIQFHISMFLIIKIANFGFTNVSFATLLIITFKQILENDNMTKSMLHFRLIFKYITLYVFIFHICLC